MTRPGLSEFGFSVKTYAAGMLALWIGLSLNLERPYWSLLTVYVLMQPLSGAVRSKGLYRFIGTIAAAAISLALIGLFANNSLALFIAIGCAELGMVYLSALDRTPRRYAFLIGGITIAVIGFPSVSAPLAAFSTAVTRTEEISVGLFCATLVDTIIFPHPAGPALNKQTTSWLEEAERRIGAVLGRQPPESGEKSGEGQGFGTFAAAATQMITLSVQVGHDTASRPPHPRIVRLLYKRMLTLLPLLSAARDLLSALRQEGGSPEVWRVLDAVHEWVGKAPDVSAAETGRVRQAVVGIAPSGRARGTWRAILLTSLRRVLTLLMETWEDCRELHGAVATGEPPSQRLARAARREVLLVPYSDKIKVLFSLLPVAVALAAVTAIWTATGWSEGLTAAEFTMIGYGLMSVQENAVAMLRLSLIVIISASCLEFIYLFAILPALHGFVLLALALALLLLPIGAFMPIPASALPATILATMTIAFMNIQGVYSADFITSLNATLGILSGLIVALVTAQVIGGPGPELSARRLMRAARADLAAIAAGRWLPDIEVYTLRALDRAMQLAPRLEGDAAPGGTPRPDPLAETRAGIGMLRLWDNRAALGTAGDAAIGRALEALAAHFSRPPDPRTDAALLGCIDESLGATAGLPSSVQRRNTVMALTGVRRALFPRVERINAPMAEAETASWDREDAT